MIAFTITLASMIGSVFFALRKNHMAARFWLASNCISVAYFLFELHEPLLALQQLFFIATTIGSVRAPIETETQLATTQVVFHGINR